MKCNCGRTHRSNADRERSHEIRVVYTADQKTLQAIANQLDAIITVRADMSDGVRKQLATVSEWAKNSKKLWK